MSMPSPQSMGLVSYFIFEFNAIHRILTKRFRCSVHWPLRSIYITWLSNAIPWSASGSRESDTTDFKSRSWIPEEVVSLRLLQFSNLGMGLEYLFFFSAIFCITGEQAAKRAKEGFDMVSCSVLIDDDACHRTLIGIDNARLMPPLILVRWLKPYLTICLQLWEVKSISWSFTVKTERKPLEVYCLQ